jgi:hypothetical protein
MKKNKQIAKTFLWAGRFFLSVNGVAVAMESTTCYDGHYEEDKWTPELLRLAAEDINSGKYLED